MCGLERELALRLVVEGVFSAAKVSLETGNHPGFFCLLSNTYLPPLTLFSALLKSKAIRPGSSSCAASFQLDKQGFRFFFASFLLFFYLFLTPL